jgi:hypothetical protein
VGHHHGDQHRRPGDRDHSYSSMVWNPVRMPYISLRRIGRKEWRMTTVAMNGVERTDLGPLWQVIKWCMWAKR